MRAAKRVLLGLGCATVIAAIAASAWFAYDTRRHVSQLRQDARQDAQREYVQEVRNAVTAGALTDSQAKRAKAWTATAPTADVETARLVLERVLIQSAIDDVGSSVNDVSSSVADIANSVDDVSSSVAELCLELNTAC